jgi:hypothetical protein
LSIALADSLGLDAVAASGFGFVAFYAALATGQAASLCASAGSSCCPAGNLLRIVGVIGILSSTIWHGVHGSFDLIHWHGRRAVQWRSGGTKCSEFIPRNQRIALVPGRFVIRHCLELPPRRWSQPFEMASNQSEVEYRCAAGESPMARRGRKGPQRKTDLVSTKTNATAREENENRKQKSANNCGRRRLGVEGLGMRRMIGASTRQRTRLWPIRR